jgi:hypothetical protein
MNRLVRNVISTVQEVAFDYSAKKLHAFFDERDAGHTFRYIKRFGQVKCRLIQLIPNPQTDSSCRSALNISITVLDSLMASRRSHSVYWWTSRADAFYTFKTSYSVVVHALICLQNQGDDKVGQFLASIMRFQLS